MIHELSAPSSVFQKSTLKAILVDDLHVEEMHTTHTTDTCVRKTLSSEKISCCLEVKKRESSVFCDGRSFIVGGSTSAGHDA